MSKVEEPQGEYRRIPKKISLEEYWEREFISEGRYEYHDGVLIDKNYASVQHGQILSNIVGLIGNYILDKDFKIYSNSRMVYIPECNKNFYPDIVLVCGKHDLRQVFKNMKATMNPSVVIEVLSDSTAEFDKTTKTRCYKKVKSIQQIIFVNQTDKYVRTLKKTDDERIWLEIDAYDDDDIVEVGECKLSIKEIYHRVAIDFESENLSDIQKY
jgi:Uma2 family endonuclease